jgi:hypothetical protein
MLFNPKKEPLVKKESSVEDLKEKIRQLEKENQSLKRERSMVKKQ